MFAYGPCGTIHVTCHEAMQNIIRLARISRGIPLVTPVSGVVEPPDWERRMAGSEVGAGFVKEVEVCRCDRVSKGPFASEVHQQSVYE